MEEQFLILSAAGTAASAVYLATRHLRLNLGPAPARALTEYLDALEPESTPAQPSLDRERVILASLGLPPREGLLTVIKATAAAVPALVLLLLGLPVVPAAGAGALVGMLTHAWLEGR